jgi:hypothetical protein
MTRNDQERQGKGALQIIEEAVHLLRRAPVGLHATYYIGSLPFILGLVYFWADMSRSAFAYEHCAEAAFGLSLLFLWMKCWQAVFAYGLKAQVYGKADDGWTPFRIGRLIGIQTAIQPSGLFVLPIALLIMVPFGWVYAFYQNALVAGDVRRDTVKLFYKKSLHQAMLWPGQNHIILSVLSILGCFVFLNLALAILFAPYLLNTLFGWETIFTLSGLHMLNTTFFATICGVSYLCMDPLMKAVYVLRCFYGDSLRSGDDLKAALKTFVQPGKAMAALVVLLLTFQGGAAWSRAATPEGSSPETFKGSGRTAVVMPTELDRSIDEVLSQRDYAWRMPRESRDSENGLPAALVEGLIRWTVYVIESIWHWLETALKWLAKLLPERIISDREERASSGWIRGVRTLTLLLSVMVVCALAIQFWRVWRRRRNRHDENFPTPILPVPDPSDDNVVADRLPADGWMAMARELIDKRELRLALRALYLASLALLAEQKMIIVAKFKSDRDYERDLRKRVHVKPELLTAFNQNLTIFESVWYGKHELSHEDMDRFTINLEKIRIYAYQQ